MLNKNGRPHWPAIEQSVRNLGWRAKLWDEPAACRRIRVIDVVKEAQAIGNAEPAADCRQEGSNRIRADGNFIARLDVNVRLLAGEDLFQVNPNINLTI